MMTDRETDRILRTWFHEGAAPLPDRVIDSVLDGLPRVRQRRRLPFSGLSLRQPMWARVVVVGLVVLALLAGLVLVAGSRLFPPPRPLPQAEGPLAGGRYVAQGPFPVRFAMSVPAGWLVAEHAGDVVALAKDEPDPRTQLVVTLVDSLYRDPCRPEVGIDDQIGPTMGDLAAALAAVPGVEASAVSPATIDGRAAASVTLTAPASFARCSAFEPPFPILALPVVHGLAEGTSDRFWVVDVDGRRLVVVARLGSAEGEREVGALVASIDFDAPVADGPSATPAAFEPLPTMPATGVVPPGVYAFEVALYRIDESGGIERLPGPHDAALQVLPGWFATPRGIASEAEAPASASIAVWSVSTVYLDPCRWQTSERRDASSLRDVAGVAAALSASRPQTPDAPAASDPPPFGWLGLSREVVLNVPDLNLDDCDEGQYRIWSDPDGDSRTAQPGEQIKIWIGDVSPAIVVVEASHLPSASPPDAMAVDAMLQQMWVGAPPTE